MIYQRAVFLLGPGLTYGYDRARRHGGLSAEENSLLGRSVKSETVESSLFIRAELVWRCDLEIVPSLVPTREDVKGACVWLSLGTE